MALNYNFPSEITETYDIIGEIGKGGGGTVFEAYHKRLQKRVVIKKQHESIRGLVNERTETDTLKKLRHSHIPSVLDIFITDEAVFTVMDFIPGRSVREILKEKEKLDENIVIEYAKQLCEALIYLHNAKPPVIHGDIKPDNIMVTPEGDVCLIDFNISSALGAANSYAFGYTIGYAAPEQIKSFEFERNKIRHAKELADAARKTVENAAFDEDKTELIGEPNGSSSQGILFDKRSDIYSFGATLYHMLTGIKPASDAAKIRPVLDIYPRMNRGLADIITRSMAPDPSDRFQSCEEIKKILDHIKRYDLAYRAKMIRRITAVGVVAVAAGIAISFGLIRLRNNSTQKFEEGLDRAYALYNEMAYEQSIELIDNELIGGKYFDLDDAYKANAYYIRGNDYLELEQYDYAIEDFDTALSLDGSITAALQDKSISLARSGRMSEAMATLQSAKEAGIDSGNLLLAQAEIEAAEGKKEDAISSYKECAETSDDEKVKARALFLCADLYDLNDADEIKEAINVLNVASDLDSGLQAGILQKLAQCYLNLASVTGDESSYTKALSVFDKIVENGWDTYTTNNNIAVIYDHMGELDKAYDKLNEMLDKYGDNYNTYKRLAFIEIEQQNERSGVDRDYSRFTEYADMAVKFYNNQKLITDDMEMDVLRDLISQLN